MAQETLKMTALGQNIITAVQDIAKKPVVKKDYIDGATVYRLGQTSGYPYEHLAISADGENLIDPTKTYQSVTVAEHGWGGTVYAVGYTQDSVIQAVKDFAQKLKTELEKYALPDEAMVQFTFEGVKYQYPQNTISPHQDIILPDGRILFVTRWEDSKPMEGSVVTAYHVVQKA